MKPEKISRAVPDLPEDPSSSVPNYVFSDQVGHLLRRAYQRHYAIFQELSCDPQLTLVQFVVLCALNDNGASFQTELVRATMIDQATIRGIVERLAARGLVTVSQHEEDRRKVVVRLTVAGTDLLNLMVPRALQVSEATMGGLNPAERVALNFLLRKIVDEQSPERIRPAALRDLLP